MFADEEYRRQVLEPARAAGDQPPEDLRVRYALSEPLVPAEVTAQVKRVRQCWRRSRGQLKYRKLVDRLEAEHRALAPAFAAVEKGDLRPLAEMLRGGEERTAARRADVRARLLDAAGAVAMISPADLATIARSGGVGGDELAWLARAERIEVREPDPLPASPPYPGYPKAREALDVLGHRQLADFLLGGPVPEPYRVLDGVRPDPRVVKGVAARWARRARDTSSSNAETVLIALKAVEDPGELLLYDIVDRLRERHRQRASEQALLHHATQELAIVVEDARRLVFAVRSEDGPAVGAAGRLRELLDTGRVHAAAELAGGLPQEGDTVVLTAEATRRVAAAAQLRARADASADPDEAWRLLTEAVTLVPDLPGAEEARRRLPPRPATAPAVSAAGQAVLLSWSGTATEYWVLRRSGAPPSPADQPLAVLEAPAFRDESAPVNEELYYAVVAVRGEAAAPPAHAAGPVAVRPEPDELELTAGDAAVTGRWNLPAQATGVVVQRRSAAGVVVLAADRLGFIDRSVTNDDAYQYRIAARYLDADGTEHVTRGVVVAVTPSAPPSPVGELELVADPFDATRVLLAFPAPRHGAPEAILLPGPPPWPHGTVLPADEVRAAGKPLPATPTADGLAVRTRGGGVLLVVTVSGRQAAVGPHRHHVSLPAPTGLALTLRPPHLHVAFDWPPDVAESLVTLRPLAAGGSARTVRVTRAGYEAEGLRIAVEPGAGFEVEVRACAGNAAGPSATARVAGRRELEYDLVRGGGRRRRELVVRLLAAAEPVRVGELRLVLRRGRVMPVRAADGETLAQWHDLEVRGELELSVPDPGVKEPYWLRCFTADETLELADPPIRRLQVS